MATPKQNINQSTDELKKFNVEAASIVTTLQEIAKALAENAKAASEFTGEAASTFKEDARDAVDLAKALQGYQASQLKDRRSLNALESKILKTEQNKARTISRISVLEQRLVSARGKEAQLLNRSLSTLQDSADEMDRALKYADGLKGELEQINNKAKFFDDLADFFKEIPGASKVFGEFGKAAEKARAAAADGGSAFKAGAKQLSGVLAKGLSATAIAFAVKGVRDIDEKSVSLSRNLNTSADQATRLAKSANEAARNIAGVTGKDIVDAQNAFANALGTTAALSNETAANFTTLQNRLGLSADQATEFTKLNEALGKDSKLQTESLIAQVQLNNAQTDSSIKYQDVIKDIAGTNKAILLSSRGNAQQLAKAAIEARKFGINLNDADKIAGSLLDFESSISAELEAELLTGRNLNLERARSAALNGDLATLTAEIAKNVGSAEEFGRMNRIQQEAIAKSVGMSREELAASLVEQQALTKLGAKDTNELREKTRLRLQEISQIKDSEEREKARAKLIADLGSDELVRQQENRTLAELQAEAAQKTVEAFDALSSILKPIKPIIEFIANNAQAIAIALGSIAALSLVGKIGRIAKAFKGVNKEASLFQRLMSENVTKGPTKGVNKLGKTFYKDAAGKFMSKEAFEQVTKQSGKGLLSKFAGKNLTKLGGKAIGKSILKKIPIVGALAGVGFALSRAAEGDWLGAAGELASGVASTIPGLGTAASIGIDTALAARDIKNESQSSPSTMQVDDFTIKSNPKDTLVMAGGTRFGEETNALLKELIAAVNKGGNVYLDGTKVGTAMAVGSYKTQ